MTEQHDAGLCAPNCRYRRLYEGSQSSLSDMSARQASALARVGRMRAGVVSVLRRAFPEEAQAAETHIGRRLSDSDDEVLLAFLENVVTRNTGREERALLEAIGHMLVSEGVTRSTTPSGSWVVEVRDSLRANKTAVVSAPSEITSQPVVEKQTAPVVSAQVELVDLFTERDSSMSDEEMAAVEALSDLFDESAPPVATSRTGVHQSSGSSKGTAQGQGRNPFLSAKDQLPPSRDEQLGWGGVTKDPGMEGKTSTEPSEIASLGDLFAEDTTVHLWSSELGDPGVSGGGWTPSPVLPANARIAATPDSPGLHPDATAKAGLVSSGTGAPEQKAVETRTTEPRTIEAPMRPELYPVSSKPQKQKQPARRKNVRVTAEPPTTGNPSESGSVDDDLRTSLLAACSIPRPVFTRDLVAIAGSVGVVESWEAECRANPDRGLRFIAPKQRHRARGSLVVPAEDLRSRSRRPGDDWWSTCTKKYLGAKLYELGVLLHRVGDEMVSSEFGEHVAVLRLNSSKGLVAIVVVLDDRIEKGEAARDALARALTELQRERLALVAVLTTLGDEREVTRLISTLSELATEREIKPSFPVVAGKSWEYADDRGSTAKLVLGS